jgi:hypothetical protein
MTKRNVSIEPAILTVLLSKSRGLKKLVKEILNKDMPSAVEPAHLNAERYACSDECTGVRNGNQIRNAHTRVVDSHCKCRKNGMTIFS